MPSPLRAVVFDLFDTLVDLDLQGLPSVRVGERSFPSTVGLLHERVREVNDVSLERFANTLSEVDKELRAPRAERGRELATLERFEAVLAKLGVGEPELAQRLTEVHMGCVREQVTHLAHHGDVLDALRGRVRLAVCSNFSHSQTALRVLEDAGLRWYFDAVIVSDAVGWRKPRAEIFHATLGALGTAPEETLHVGDSLAADVAGAAALGLRTAWLTRCVRDPERARREHAGAAPDHVIGDLREVLALVSA